MLLRPRCSSISSSRPFPPVTRAGSFIQYVRERYGLSGVRALWTGGRYGLARTVGTTVGEVEEEWLRVLGGVDVPQQALGRVGPLACEGTVATVSE